MFPENYLSDVPDDALLRAEWGIAAGYGMASALGEDYIGKALTRAAALSSMLLETVGASDDLGQRSEEGCFVHEIYCLVATARGVYGARR